MMKRFAVNVVVGGLQLAGEIDAESEGDAITSARKCLAADKEPSWSAKEKLIKKAKDKDS